MAVVSISFTHKTIYFLDVPLYWYQSFDMPDACRIYSLVMALAVLIPTMSCNPIVQNKLSYGSSSTDLPTFTETSFSLNSSASSSLMDEVSDSSEYPDQKSNIKDNTNLFQHEDLWDYTNRCLFEFLLPIVGLAFGAMELLIRDQSWTSTYDLPVDVIYPIYYFIFSSFIMVIASYALYSASVIRFSTLIAVLLIQTSKILHLVSVPSDCIISLSVLILLYIEPFVIFEQMYSSMWHKIAAFYFVWVQIYESNLQISMHQTRKTRFTARDSNIEYFDMQGDLPI